MSSKAQLQAQAKSLNLPTTGTISDLQRRIRSHATELARLDQQIAQAARRQQDEAFDQRIWDSVESFDDNFEQQPAETLPRHTAIGPAMGVAALVSALFS